MAKKRKKIRVQRAPRKSYAKKMTRKKRFSRGIF